MKESLKVKNSVIYKCTEEKNSRVSKRDVATATDYDFPIKIERKTASRIKVEDVEKPISNGRKDDDYCLYSQFWYPNTYKERILIKAESTTDYRPDLYSGIRGMYNMGNACYMLSLVQVFIHTPTMRDFFLSGAHECLGSDEKGHTIRKCIFCIFKDLFSKVFIFV